MDHKIQTEIATAALRVARFVHDGRFAGIIVSGGSHQLSRALLALGWGTLYPSEPIPRTFVLDAAGNSLLYKSTFPDERGVFRPDAEAFGDWVRKHAPGLEEMKQEHLVFVDDFMLSGVKYKDAKEFLPRYLGYTDVSFAFFVAHEDANRRDEEAFIGVKSTELASELHRMGQNMQGKEGMEELLAKVRPTAEAIRSGVLEELREIGREMKR